MVEPIKDAADREIKVGDVVVKFYAVQSHMRSRINIVRELTGRTGDDQVKLKTDELYRTYPYQKKGEDGEYHEVFNYELVPNQIKVPEYCVVIEMTEAELKAKYGIE